jgi:hypothetical protein
LKPDQVESNLDQVFGLASKWAAVLLLWVQLPLTSPRDRLANDIDSDEADVFLEARGTDKGDLNRNSLVTGKKNLDTS